MSVCPSLCLSLSLFVCVSIRDLQALYAGGRKNIAFTISSGLGAVGTSPFWYTPCDVLARLKATWTTDMGSDDEVIAALFRSFHAALIRPLTWLLASSLVLSPLSRLQHSIIVATSPLPSSSCKTFNPSVLNKSLV